MLKDKMIGVFWSHAQFPCESLGKETHAEGCGQNSQIKGICTQVEGDADRNPGKECKINDRIIHH